VILGAFCVYKFTDVGVTPFMVAVIGRFVIGIWLWVGLPPKPNEFR
jgi:hypothetical protein